MAFKDINPARAAIHFLIIPVKHITVYDLEEEDTELVGHIFQVAKNWLMNII